MLGHESENAGGAPARRKELETLRHLVQRHQVVWEVWPEYQRTEDGKTVQVGFDLTLQGTYDHPLHEPRPGCNECVKVYEDLRRIARWILPKGEHESTYELGAFDGAIHYPPERKHRAEIEFPIRIFHRHGFERPVDACETSCLTEMEEKLKTLGAPRTSWHERPGAIGGS